MGLDDLGPIALLITAIGGGLAWLDRRRPDREDRIVVRAEKVAGMTFEGYEMERNRADREQVRAERAESALAECQEEAARMRQELRDDR